MRTSNGTKVTAETVRGAVLIMFNITFVVSIVLINKQLYSTYNFKFGNTIMFLHFAGCAIAIWTLAYFGFVERKPMPVTAIGSLAVSNYLSVMFVNLSLLYNSVGMYQILKLANIPVLCCIEYAWLGKTYPPRVLASLVILMIGIAICVVTEVRFSMVGFVHGAIATVATGVYQILVGTEQKKYSVNGWQVLMWIAPPAALLFGATIPITDNVPKLLAYQMTTEVFMWILMSCVFAFGINLTVMLIIGAASPLTFQVVGHLKTTLVFIFGFVVMKEPVHVKNIIGILVAMAGLMWYSFLNMPSSPPPAPPTDAELVKVLGSQELLDDEDEVAR